MSAIQAMDLEHGAAGDPRVEPIVREPALDSTLALLLEGYDFIRNRCRRLRTDVFRTRLFLRPTICMTGEEATRLFYDARRFERRGAAPRRLRTSLLGVGGVHGLDDAHHRARKAMFMQLMNEASVARLRVEVEAEWEAAIDRWTREDREIVLMDEAERILCIAAGRWAGVPLPESEVETRRCDLSAMIDGAGALGARHRRAVRARRRCEAWIADLVDLSRPAPPTAEATPLSTIANFREPDGRWLPRRVAAVEVLDLLRPIVAIGRFVAFAALALHGHADARDRVIAGGRADALAFVHEVRRFYPFVPFVAARVRETFVWRGLRFPAHARVLLDLHGTGHDARIWGDPEKFRPERFLRGDPGAFAFVPQGGGDPFSGHRCAGEQITIELMVVAVDALTRRIAYELPDQDLRIDRRRMPTAPSSGVRIRDVRRALERDAVGLVGLGPAEIATRDADDVRHVFSPF
jgi:fatty-acid peroxygenase